MTTETDEPDVIETDVPEAEAPEISAEDRALTMGWTPKEQFKGDPSKWVDAETFVKRGEEFLPFLKANNRRLEQAHERSQKELAELKASLKEVRDYTSKAEERAYQRALKDLQAELDQAAAAGDVEGVRAVTDDIRKLEKEVSAPAPKDNEPPAYLTDWKADNPWFESDRVLKAAAIEIAQELTEAGVTGKAQLDAVSKRIKAEFPTKFENPNRRQASAVEGAGSAPRRSGKGYTDLPSDAKAACDRWVKQGLMTREDYVKNYQWG